MFEWLENLDEWVGNLDGGSKSFFALAMCIIGYCFIIAALGWMGIVGTFLMVGGAALWTVAEDDSNHEGDQKNN